jgi:hypothetical protein
LACNLGQVGDFEHHQHAMTTRQRRLLQNVPHITTTGKPPGAQRGATVQLACFFENILSANREHAVVAKSMRAAATVCPPGCWCR